MKIKECPTKNEWVAIVQRPEVKKQDISNLIQQIFYKVSLTGDAAVKEFTQLYDGVNLNTLKVNEYELNRAATQVDEKLKKAINVAAANIYKFHAAQKQKPKIINTTKGIKCWRKSVPIDKVGIYIPGGTAALFSTILMLGIPAKIAGCNEVVLCSPPNEYGKLSPVILYTAQLVGITKVFTVGGAQAIAAMTFGTESIPKVFKILGPGNQYVTAAKQAALNFGVAIDMPAGPSELLVIADDSCNPAFVAADLLSQAEHGVDSQVILVSTQTEIITKVLNEVDKQLNDLSRKSIAAEALTNSLAIIFKTIDECIEFSNVYAPEHLIVAVKNPKKYTKQITNAGSVFLGNYSCESAGDYASGTNHTLPTNGYAKNYSGVSVESFTKQITFQKLTKKGLAGIRKSIEVMAEAEQLGAHKNAVSIRFKN